MEFRQLNPERRVIVIDNLLATIDFGANPPHDRPYTLVNFVASADGRAVYQGRSGALGDEGDRAMFHSLRARVDAVFAGTGTMRTERYGRIIKDPDRREERSREGLQPEPLAVLMSRSGDVPTDIPLFAEPEARIAVFGPREIDTSHTRARTEIVVLDPGELTLTTMMRRLRSHHGIRSLLCEGGPTVFSSMLHEGLVDELFLTVAPKLTGGGMGPAITAGAELPELAEMQPIWVLERSGSLFLRYALRNDQR